MAKRSARTTGTGKHHFNPFVVIPAFLLGAAATFLVTTVFAQMSNEEIYACVNKINGQLRIVTVGSDCKNNESSLSWNKQGPQGEPGTGGQSAGLPRPLFCNNCYLKSHAAEFAGKDFSQSQIYSSEFSSADLTGVNFSDSYFRNVNFTNANLTNVNFSNVKDLPGWDSVRNNNFSNANLTNANFSGSTFRNSNFTNANLQGADFSNAEIRYNDFTGADNGGTANFSGAVWEDTRCPDGTNSDANGSTCAGHF